MNKKAESPITIISSVLVLIVVFMVYYFFFILQGANQIELNEQVEQRGDIVLINFVKLNYNLILSSEKSGDYSDLENEFGKLYYLGDCVNLEINQEILRKDGCMFEESYAVRGETPRSTNFNWDVLADRNSFQIQIPGYNNQIISIILKIKNE
ncbi:hypothetical protein J4425_02780 [Candidatus Woesearchaeota archaeon]|nr:hypothetical protein [Candidatus Woesearchaeota archaeon]